MNRRHNLLYLAFNFPPFAGPGPRHNLSTVRRLFAANFVPTVITAPEAFERLPTAHKWPKDEYLRSQIPEEVTIIRCPWSFKYHDFWGFILQMLRFTPLPYSFKRGRNRLYEVSRRELDRGDYELIYSVNGIGIEHQAALDLKRSTGLPWIAEFRDPWIYNLLEWNAIKARSWQWWYRHQLEKTKQILREIVHSADLIVVESPMHAELLITDFNLERRKVVPFGIGYETDYLRDIKGQFVEFPTRPAIGFVGQMYHGYYSAIKNLTEALSGLEREAYGFTFVSVGGDKTLHKLANEAKLGNFLPIDNVDYLRAVSIMKQLDFGIVATCEQCLPHINSKLWEYLALGLSILAIAPNEGSMATILEEGNCGYLLPYDKESMMLALRHVFNEYKDGTSRRARAEFVEGYSRETIFAELVKRIERLL